MEAELNQDNLARAIRRNIEAIARIEDDYNRRRSFSHRIADAIGDFSGSMTFVLIHVILYGGWILINLGVLKSAPLFDPYPFMLLSVVVSLEAIFLSAFVLMKQNRMGQRADDRAHLDLQVNLLAEREMTLLLQMVRGISDRMGMGTHHEELRELLEETSVEAMSIELQKAMDPETGSLTQDPPEAK